MSSRTKRIQNTKRNAAFLWRQALAGGRKRLWVAVGCASVASLCAVPQAWFLSGLIDKTLSGVSVSVVPVVGVMLLRSACTYAGESQAAALAASVRVHLRHKLFGNLLERGPVVLATRETGALATTLIEQIEALDGYIGRYLPQSVVVKVSLPVILVTMLMVSPWAAGVLLSAMVLAPVIMAFVGIASARASRRQFDQMHRLSGAFYDRLRNLEVLRIFGAATRESVKLRSIADEFRARTMAVLRLAFMSSASLELVAMLAMALIAIHLMRGAFPRQNALFALLLVPDFFAPLRALLSGYHDRASALAAVDSLIPLMESAPLAPLGYRTLEAPLVTPTIDFQNVTFGYEGREALALNNLSFHVAGGEFLALSGESGAGKSTILSLLLGFVQQTSGRIAVANLPLETLEPQHRAESFAWVGQRSRLFYGTLRENIRLGKPHASDSAIEGAAEQAGLTALIASLPQGLDTVIGERGFGLSGGQAQRVALARAFLRDAPILLLDEPTAGLDSETAQSLIATIRTLARNRTVVMVSHDAAALAAADRVLVLRDGKCAI